MAGEDTPQDRLIIEIDADEFEEAQHDPRVHAFLAEATAYGEQVQAEGRDRTDIDDITVVNYAGFVAYVAPSSKGGYIAGSSDGIETITPAATPEEAIDNLMIAKQVESRSATDENTDLSLEDVISEFGYNPEDLESEPPTAA